MAQRAAESEFEVSSGKGCFRRSAGQHGAFDHHRVIAKLADRTEIVGRNQQGTAVVAQLAQQGDDLGFGLDVNAGKRLIQQNDLALLSDGAGKEHPFFLSAGQLADLPVAIVAHPDAGQRRINHFPVMGFGPSQPAHMSVAAHHDDILHQYREGPVNVL